MQKEKSKAVAQPKYTVSVRIRPKIKETEETVFVPSKGKSVKELRPKSILTYSFDNVFDETHDNEQIFGKSIKDKIDSFLKNRTNTTILAYGQTGSGKTHTLFGHKLCSEKGLVHHIIDQVMNYCQQKELKASCTFLQVYKQKVTDLLNGQEVSLRDNSKGQLVLDGNKTETVASKEQLIALLQKANQNKIFGNSYINSESSRSHVLFYIEVEGTFLNILDLCGNQVLTFKFDEKQRAQTNAINLSLFTLNAVISDLCQQNQSKFIPFRNSVLTRLLKKSLIDQKKMQVYLFCNISPQKQHQEFSSSTLRFGQLAIEIDEKDNVVEQKVNLSQQKRDTKKVSNIIDIHAQQSTKFYDLPEPWQRSKCNILGKKTIIYRLEKANANINILLLHAYGGGCDGTDWNTFASNLIMRLNCNLYSADFPGFGKSEGEKFTSRAQKFHQKQQPLEFMSQLLKELKFNKANPVFLLGYDLGGAIALRMGMELKFTKSIAGIMVLHPTWTDKIEKLSIIQNDVLLLWFPVETLHLVSAGMKMAKTIKNCTLYKFNIGPYTTEKTCGYYDRYYQQVCDKIVEFVEEKASKEDQTIETSLGNARGKIVEEKIQVDVNKEEEKLLRTRQAVQEFFKFLANDQEDLIFDAIIKGGQNKPKFIKLVGNLPSLTPESISLEYLQKHRLLQNLPESIPSDTDTPFLTPGRQVHIRQKVNLSVLHGQQSYLAYDSKHGELGITHKAYISSQISPMEVFETGQVQVDIKTVAKGQNEQKMQKTTVEIDNIIQLNSPTNFKKNVLGHTIFEDNVSCNYESSVMKLLMNKICFKLKKLFSQISKQSLSQKAWLSLQQKATETIFKVMNLRHLVHEGIDNTRYTGTDAGRLAYYGQGNCHHLASTLAALLLPFGKVFGWEVIFRAGSFFMTGRQLDQNGNPLEKWNGKPNVNVQDHTWLEIVYKPSNKIFVFDPSFIICNVDLDHIYSLKGKMHISGKPLNFAYPPMAPQNLC